MDIGGRAWKQDPGGATNRGITFATLKAWRDQPITKQDVKDLTVEEAKDSIETYQLVVKGEPESSLLYQVLVSPGGEGNTPRMPYDQPLSDIDVALIHDWIAGDAQGLD